MTTVVVDDLGPDEVDGLAWSGAASHLASIRRLLERRSADGSVEYLVARDASGRSVSKAAIDYDEHPGAGTIIQVATRRELEGRGHARLLLEEAERRIRARGLDVARLAVEPDNDRARRLYEWLGYAPVGERETGWEQELEDGTLGWYRTMVVDMEKAL